MRYNNQKWFMPHFCAKQRATKGSWLTFAATAAIRRSEAQTDARSNEPHSAVIIL